MNRTYRSIRHQLLSKAKSLLLPRRLKFALRHCDNLVVIEVGANDGKTGDPAHHFIQSRRRCKALLIEPVPYLFERLQRNYSRVPGCVPVNVAVGPVLGSASIYYIDPEAKKSFPELPHYFEELASFDKRRITSVLGDRAASLLRERVVKTIPLRTLLEERGISKVDFLQIDTEGYDYQVLKTFPFDLGPPRLVCFEHCHLSQSDRTAAVSLMANYGYSVEKWGKDFVCVRRSGWATQKVRNAC
jgi:FkbM family methyltransferase